MIKKVDKKVKILTDIKCLVKVLTNIKYSVEHFQRQWINNISNLNDIPFDTIYGVGLPFFERTLKDIKKIKVYVKEIRKEL
jgi:TRAP-type C4-dicarboxylate transport system permease small subunit